LIVVDPARARVTGPLQPYAEGFTAELARLGYTSGSAYGQMLLMAHASRWLAGEGLDAGGLTPEAAGRFLAARRAAGYVLYLSPKALEPLLGFLRRVGAAPEAPSPIPAGPADALLGRYQRYLVTERGLAAETASDYAAKVRAFAAARADRGLAGLTAAEVTAFVVQTCPSMRKGTAKADGDSAAVAAGLAAPGGRDPGLAGLGGSRCRVLAADRAAGAAGGGPGPGDADPPRSSPPP
jgi:integrase/recombinase XerD